MIAATMMGAPSPYAQRMMQAQALPPQAEARPLAPPDGAVLSPEARLALAEERSNQAWDKVGNPETWRQAGLSREEAAGLRERARGQALQMVGGNEKHPLFGEALYMAQADQLANWAGERSCTGRYDSPQQAQAIVAMAEGGHEYVKSRSEWLQLSGGSQ